MPHLLSNDICIEFSSRCLANAEFCLKVQPRSQGLFPQAREKTLGTRLLKVASLFYFDLSFGS